MPDKTLHQSAADCKPAPLSCPQRDDRLHPCIVCKPTAGSISLLSSIDAQYHTVVGDLPAHLVE